jgi:multiple sugar transport system ATP-binding protein
MPKIVLENLTKKYGKNIVVNKLNLEVKHGEFISLLGPPGAGKTTILRMIAGLVAQDEGNIYIGDKLVNDLPPHQRDVAMVFQSYALYPHLNVYDNLAFPLRKKKMSQSEVESKVKSVSDMLGINHLLEKPPALLSGGERQRVAIGRAIIRDPKVLLMDEPLSNLDAKLRLHMRAELRKLQKKLNLTAIIGTPDELEALTMADKVAVLNEGKLIQYDETETVYDRPNCLFVAKFVGSPPINLMRCVYSDGENPRLDFKDFSIPMKEFKDRLTALPAGSEVIFGVRPSSITLHERKIKDSIEALVYTLEPMGAETVVALKVGENILKTKVPSSLRLNMDERVWVTFNKKEIHLFDVKTEQAIM